MMSWGTKQAQGIQVNLDKDFVVLYRGNKALILLSARKDMAIGGLK